MNKPRCPVIEQGLRGDRTALDGRAVSDRSRTLSFALRWAIFQTGRASALDPHASFALQRAGFAGAEATGRPAVADPPRAVPQMQRNEDFIKV